MRHVKIKFARGTVLNIARLLFSEKVYTAWQWNALLRAILHYGHTDEAYDLSSCDGLRRLYERGGYL